MRRIVIFAGWIVWMWVGTGMAQEAITQSALGLDRFLEFALGTSSVSGTVAKTRNGRIVLREPVLNQRPLSGHVTYGRWLYNLAPVNFGYALRLDVHGLATTGSPQITWINPGFEFRAGIPLRYVRVYGTLGLGGTLLLHQTTDGVTSTYVTFNWQYAFGAQLFLTTALGVYVENVHARPFGRLERTRERENVVYTMQRLRLSAWRFGITIAY